MKPNPVTLITNLEYVLVDGTGVRTHTHALVITQPDAEDLGQRLVGPHAVLRGFAYSHTNGTFDMHIPSGEYTTEAAASHGMQFLKDDGSTTPLVTGLLMRFKDGPTLQLQRWCDAADTRPIHVETIEADDSSELYRRLWTTLDDRIGEFWPREGMPVVAWTDKRQALSMRRQISRAAWG